MMHIKDKVVYCGDILEDNLIEGHILKRLSDGLCYTYLGDIKDYDKSCGFDIIKYAVFFGFIVNKDYLKKFFETENSNLVIYEEKKRG